MRDFFKQELETLKAKTGLNQYENFSAMVDSEGKSIAAKQIGILLDSMVLACNEFPYIPDMDKCLIIQKMIIQDQDFTALNSRAVWKWLNMHKDIYWQKANGKQEEVIDNRNLPPLSEKTKKMIAEFQAELLETSTPKFLGLGLTMEKIKDEDESRLNGEEVKRKATPDPRPVFVVDVKDEEGNVIETVENVKASTPEKAQEIATDYVRKKYNI